MYTRFLAPFLTSLSIVSSTVLKSREISGNAISAPGLNEVVPVGQPYTITWNPTTQGTVSLYLLRGPSENVVLLDTIAQGVPNTGTYSWTPSVTLSDDKTHYGINLTADGTSLYQYSTQFGISNPAKKGSDSSSLSSSTSLPSSSSTLPTTSGSIASSPSSSNAVISTKSDGSTSANTPAPGTSSTAPQGSTPVTAKDTPTTPTKPTNATKSSSAAALCVGVPAGGIMALMLLSIL